MFIDYEEVRETLFKVFQKAGLDNYSALICAEVHTDSSAAGVESRGLNPVPRFLEYLEKGYMNPEGVMELYYISGPVEQYDGNLGIGIINALEASDRSIEIAEEYGVGIVTLKNTTHWMRGGTYGWNAAEKGFISICWTNTGTNMPVWGAVGASVGNNPICIAIPREEGPLVLDMSTAQYSYGKLETARQKGKDLSYSRGYDKEGDLSYVSEDIVNSRRVLPIGYWKGSGLAIMLDALAAVMSDGLTGPEIDKMGKGSSGGCSQVFITINPEILGDKDEIEKKLGAYIEFIKGAEPVEAGMEIYYPGERTKIRYEKALKDGINVNEEIWNEILDYLES